MRAGRALGFHLGVNDARERCEDAKDGRTKGFHSEDARATPNRLKLSDCGGAARHLPLGWNGGQMTQLRRTVGRRIAGAVTRRSGSLQRMVERIR